LKKKLEVLVWLLPASALKNRILTFFGHEIASSARIGSVLALNVGHAVIGRGATIAALNTFRSLRLLEMGDEATMGSFNMISAHPVYQSLDPAFGSLIMGNGAIMTSRHYVDCSGLVQTGDLSAISGQRTTILTHEIAFPDNVQTVGRITLGERSALSTNCVVLKGAILPPRSALGANSTLMAAKEPHPAPGIYAGNPAKHIKSIPSSSESWFERKESATHELRVDPPLVSISAPRNEAADTSGDHLLPSRAWTAASAGLAEKSERRRP
jgi:acetyltransferase-like isoleucine patch superfamily enzyme